MLGRSLRRPPLKPRISLDSRNDFVLKFPEVCYGAVQTGSDDESLRSDFYRSEGFFNLCLTLRQEEPMKLIKAIIRPNKLEEVKDALTKLGISGMTVTEVRGHGRQKGHKAIYRGTEYSVTLLPKIMVELVLPDQMVDDAIKTVIETARTGEIGDGRVFIFPVEQGYNIRTGEKDVT